MEERREENRDETREGRTETTDLITKLWWCFKTVSYDRLKQTWREEEVSVCMFWRARWVKCNPLSMPIQLIQIAR
jgi:hypothetical protein